MTERKRSHADFIAAVKPVCEASTDRNEYRAWVALPEALERLAEAEIAVHGLVEERDIAEAERDELRAEVERLERELSIATDGFAASWARGPYHG